MSIRRFALLRRRRGTWKQAMDSRGSVKSRLCSFSTGSMNASNVFRTTCRTQINCERFWNLTRTLASFGRTRVQAANSDLDAEARDVVQNTSSKALSMPIVASVETQPLLASVERLIEAMDYIGSPLPETVISELKQMSTTDDAGVVYTASAGVAGPNVSGRSLAERVRSSCCAIW